MKSAGGVTRSEDGTISIAPAAAPAAPQASLPDRAVLVFSDGRYVGVAPQQPKIDIPAREAVNFGALVPASNALAPSTTSSIANPSANGATGPAAPGVINLNQFNIGSSGSITVQQPGASAATLNRVTGNTATPNIISGAPAPNSSVTVK